VKVDAFADTRAGPASRADDAELGCVGRICGATTPIMQRFGPASGNETQATARATPRRLLNNGGHDHFDLVEPQVKGLLGRKISTFSAVS
jgi:hypothetical protein